jgi:DNA-directed RNA polymerase subunit N (RpoN/RPB10)
MSYMKCPTCKTLFGDKESQFREETKKIGNLEISKEEKDDKVEELLGKLGFNPLENYCCRMRFITMIDPAVLIK